MARERSVPATDRESVDERLRRDLEGLDREEKLKVLAFTRELRAKWWASERGGALLAFVGAIPEHDLAAMERAIEEDCERVDDEAW